jgi:hypothetical protein
LECQTGHGGRGCLLGLLDGKDPARGRGVNFFWVNDRTGEKRI